MHDINLDSKFAINYLESNDIDDLFKSRLTCQILMRWKRITTQPKNKIPNLKNDFSRQLKKWHDSIIVIVDLETCINLETSIST